MGVGFGLMFLIALSGIPPKGIGVGGFLVIVGLAFLVNSLFEQLDQQPPPTSFPHAAAPPSSARARARLPFPPRYTSLDPYRYNSATPINIDRGRRAGHAVTY